MQAVREAISKLKPDATPPNPFRNALNQFKPRVVYPARWYGLLETLGLTDTGSFRTQPVQTDYLPSDIPAAPILAEVASIVLLAAYVGCDDITLASNGFPQARGNASQLTFREHPQLGFIAVFDLFVQETIYLNHTAAMLQSAHELAYGGRIRFDDRWIGGVILTPDEDWAADTPQNILESLKSISRGCPHSHCRQLKTGASLTNLLTLMLLLADPPFCVRAFP
jgi:hypothetical protein